jgi:hypothetical protein
MDKDKFKHPELVKELNEAQVPLWFWNDRLDESELIHQLELMSSKGITCCAPHARTGFVGEYLNQGWMDTVKQVIKYKLKHGESMWLYDEFNWPAGIADGRVTQEERFREKYLTITSHYVRAGDVFRTQPVHIRKKNVDPHEMITSENNTRIDIDNLAVYDVKTMMKLDNGEFQISDYSGTLFDLSENDFEIIRDRDTIVFEAKVQTEPYNGEGFYDPDYLNADATQRFLQITYEAYADQFPGAMGSVITAGFNDETRFCHAFPWTDNLPETFERQFGYKIEEHFAELIIPGDEAGRVRCNYFELIANMYRDNYHTQIYNWCKNHKIEYCPHMLGEETLAGQVRFSGDFMRQIKATSKPGVDHLGKGIGSLNLRFASSAAELYGKSGLACEAFAASGWDLTFNEYIRMISWMYSQGVETIVNHGFFYSVRDFRSQDWPPSQFFQWDGWKNMDKANAMCRRLYGIMRESQRKSEVLIYHPVESYWLHYIADQKFTHGFHKGPFIQDGRAMQIDHCEQEMLNRLQELNCDFTMFNSDAADQFGVLNGSLVQKNTGASYSVFVIPLCEVLPVKTAELLLEFARTGGTVIFVDQLPKYDLAKNGDSTICGIVQELMKMPQTVFFDSCDYEKLAGLLQDIVPQEFRVLEGMATCKKSKVSYPEWISDPYIHTGEDMTGISWTKLIGEYIWYYIVNYTDTIQNMVVSIKSSIVPEIWDPYTGNISEAHLLLMESGEARIQLELPVGYGILIKAK